jgi:hypothetical protein
MPVVRGQFDAFIVPGARKVYIDEYNELPAVYPNWLNIETSTRAFEEELVSTGLPIAVAKPEGEPIPFDRPRFRGKVRYIHTGFGLGYEVTREAVEDDLYKAITAQGSTNLARSMREAEEVSAHSLLNNSFGSVMAYDGVPLISTAHPGVGSLTFANRPTTDVDLSVTALKAMSETFMMMQTDRGLRIQMAPTQLIVATAGWYDAVEILGASFDNKNDRNNQTPNVTQRMGLNPMHSPYITDPDAWWVNSGKGKHRAKFFWRRQPAPENGYDARTQISWFGTTARWSVGVTDWRGWYGSSGG